MTITEKGLWNLVTPLELNLPENIRDSPLMTRLCRVLKIIKEAIQQVGITEYGISVKCIKNELTMKGDDVEESTIYRYVRKALSSKLISIETKTIASYQKIELPIPSVGKIPSIHLVDDDGIDIYPSRFSDLMIFKESGESTFKMYKLTEKGENLLNLFFNGEE